MANRIRVEGGAGDDYLYGGSGDDTLLGGDGVDLKRGGAGNDIIGGNDGDDNIEGGDGNDYLVGHSGADYISGGNGKDTVMGGDGRDSLYGGAGDDRVYGGAENDYIDGGLGNDDLYGDDGNDAISGGKRDDKLKGGTGSDTLIGASGADRYLDANSDDTIITDAPDKGSLAATGANVEVVERDPSLNPESIVTVNGRDEFTSRVADDMETYRSLSSDQAMLRGLAENTANTGATVTITELNGTQEFQELLPGDPASSRTTEGGYARPEHNNWKSPEGATGTASNSEIFYNPSVNIPLSEATGKEAVPPSVVLFHEMSHAYYHTGGTGIAGVYNVTGGDDATRPGWQDVNNVERQAVGLPVGFDVDGDPLTADQEERPGLVGQSTENDLRRELGIGERVSYRLIPNS